MKIPSPHEFKKVFLVPCALYLFFFEIFLFEFKDPLATPSDQNRPYPSSISLA
jgi:hypothetical protein